MYRPFWHSHHSFDDAAWSRSYRQSARPRIVITVLLAAYLLAVLGALMALS
jgi:hypothetical protein